MTKEQFISKYGFQPGDQKWLTGGGNILKYIGLDVIYATYEMDKESGDLLKTSYQDAKIHDIYGYDPVKMTYKIKYTIGKDPEVKEEIIIPEGFIMIKEGVEKPTTLHKFIPYSLHMKMIEIASYHKMVGDYFDNNKRVIPFKGLKVLAENKDQTNILSYPINLVAAIRPTIEKENNEIEVDENEIYIFRISKLSLRHKVGKDWILSLTDQERNTFTILIKEDEEFYEFFLKDRVGDLKIIDLGGGTSD